MADSLSRPKRRYFLAGILTIIPLWITWLVLSLLFRTLSGDAIAPKILNYDALIEQESSANG